MIFADQEIETVKGKSMMPKLKGKDAKRRDAWLSERMFTDAVLYIYIYIYIFGRLMTNFKE